MASAEPDEEPVASAAPEVADEAPVATDEGDELFESLCTPNRGDTEWWRPPVEEALAEPEPEPVDEWLWPWRVALPTAELAASHEPVAAAATRPAALFSQLSSERLNRPRFAAGSEATLGAAAAEPDDEAESVGAADELAWVADWKPWLPESETVLQSPCEAAGLSLEADEAPVEAPVEAPEAEPVAEPEPEAELEPEASLVLPWCFLLPVDVALAWCLPATAALALCLPVAVALPWCLPEAEAVALCLPWCLPVAEEVALCLLWCLPWCLPVGCSGYELVRSPPATPAAWLLPVLFEWRPFEAIAWRPALVPWTPWREVLCSTLSVSVGSSRLLPELAWFTRKLWPCEPEPEPEPVLDAEDEADCSAARTAEVAWGESEA